MGSVVLACALVGLVFGPLLAALTLELAGRWPVPTLRLLRGGRASSARVLGVTIASVAVAGLLGAHFGAVAELPAFLVLGAAGCVLAVVDVEHHRLPDRIVLPAYPVGAALLLVAALATGDVGRWLGALAAMGVVFAAFFLLVFLSPEGFGFGDAKLGGLLGLHLGWLGWSFVLTGLLAGFVLGALAAVVLIAVGRATLRGPVAFGPALLAGALLTILTVGPPVAG